ncbi:GspE/PulE family protein [Desulfopila inferna]|uniref:GspE/PulE family protein n=1 Tax=Desulfopila inferna TaxID=468528 RepID=UPI001965BEDF|nr:GspE/PulE family protein [Desulfopila inferna]MBM9606645.1 GspE/PulE family protein [Desulfopila inferna]
MAQITPLPRNERTSTTFDDHFKKLVNQIHSASTPNAIMVGLRNKILKIYDVEMATIFLADAKKHQLVSWVLLTGSSLTKFRININRSSIAGFVAETKQKLNISNVYDKDELTRIHPTLTFDTSWDKKSGCRTRQVLLAPIVFKNNVLGVIQLINKRNGAEFDTGDEKRITELSETLGIALYNHYKSGKKVPMRYEELIRRDIISAQEMERALVIATQQELDVETVLMENFMVAKTELGETLAFVYKTKFVDLSQTIHSAGSLLKGKDIDIFRRNLLVPLQKKDDTLFLAAKDPANQSEIPLLKDIFEVEKINFVLSFGDDIRECLSAFAPEDDARHSDNDRDGQTDTTEAEEEIVIEVDSRPAIELVNKIIEEAYNLGASDIHIEPYGNIQDAEVRFRVDGNCIDTLRIPKSNAKSIIARIKVMADLNISERRKPQDGKIKFTTTQAENIELRVATVPTSGNNEDVVLRILADSKPLPLEDIMPPRALKRLTATITKPHGLFLVVGPTGSGKTTTLHSALSYINTTEKKIWTAEDPVEITQHRLRQVQVRPNIGYTFAAAMRAFLRADPDVIMIGEMRDFETAKMGIEASLTGHLVFSTLHTNSAAETVVRLIDMGLDPFNFADSLLGILAQRLIRTLCDECKEAYNPTRQEYDYLVDHYGVLFYDHIQQHYSPSLTLYRAKGCEACNNLGYKGRAGLFELLLANKTIKQQIIEKASAEKIKQEAINGGMTVLLQEGLHLVFSGKTDIKQVMATCIA